MTQDNLSILNKALMAVAIISLISSFIVVLTPILFIRMRNNFFLRLLCIVSFCNLMYYISILLNFSDSPWTCQIQGYLNTFFFLASWSWMSNMQLQLFGVLHYKKPYFTEVIMHLIFWLIPLIVSFVPFLDEATYGHNSHNSFFLICYLKDQYKNQSIILYATQIFTFVLLCIVFGAIFYYKSSMSIVSQHRTYEEQCHLKIMMKGITYYLIAFVVLWLPNLLSQVISNSASNDSSGSTASGVLFIFSNLQGLVLTVIFFLNSKEARFRWKKLLFDCSVDNSIMTNNAQGLRADAQVLQDVLDNDAFTQILLMHHSLSNVHNSDGFNLDNNLRTNLRDSELDLASISESKTYNTHNAHIGSYISDSAFRGSRANTESSDSSGSIDSRGNRSPNPTSGSIFGGRLRAGNNVPSLKGKSVVSTNSSGSSSDSLNYSGP